MNLQKKQKLTFHASETTEAQKALKELLEKHQDSGLNNADALIALGGDGTLLECLHKVRGKKIPVYGLNCGSIGFLLNPYNIDKFEDNLSNAHKVTIYPLVMTATDTDGNKTRGICF